MIAGAAVASVTFGMGLFLVLHVTIWRWRPSNAPRLVLLAGLGVLGMAFSMIWGCVAAGYDPFLMWGIGGVDCAIIVGYLFVYAGVSRSVSLTLLTRLAGEAGQTVDFQRLLEEYTASSRFEDRVELMGRSGLLTSSGGTVTLTRKGARLARFAKILGGILGGGLRG